MSKNITSKTHPVEFGGLFGNIILATLLPILVILAKIAIKTVIKIFQFYNFSMILIMMFFQKGNLIPFPRGYLRLANYYDQDVFIWTAAIVFLQLLISLVPLAKKSKSLTRFGNDYKFIYYRFSG